MNTVNPYCLSAAMLSVSVLAALVLPTQEGVRGARALSTVQHSSGALDTLPILARHSAVGSDLLAASFALEPEVDAEPQATERQEESARARQQREENARREAEQQRAEQQRIEKARQTQEPQRATSSRAASPPIEPKFRDAVGRLIAAERIHREQLARINRLKQIAAGAGQTERVAALDRLLSKSNESFDQKLQVAQRELPQADFTNAIHMLEQGRRREVKGLIGGNSAPSRTTAPVDRPPAAEAKKPTRAPERPPH